MLSDRTTALVENNEKLLDARGGAPPSQGSWEQKKSSRRGGGWGTPDHLPKIGEGGREGGSTPCSQIFGGPNFGPHFSCGEGKTVAHEGGHKSL